MHLIKCGAKKLLHLYLFNRTALWFKIKYMRRSFLFGALLSLVIACHEDEVAERRMEPPCDPEKVAAYPGTMCCLSGPLEMKPGETATFLWQTNLNNPSYAWSIYEGSLEIVGDADSNTVTVKAGANFNGGIITVTSEAPLDGGCAESLSITRL